MRLIAYAALPTFDQMRPEDIRMLDAVNLYRFGVQPDGSPHFFSEPDFSCIPRFRAIHPSIRFLLMLGGNQFGCEHCSDAFSHKSGREKFADGIMDLLKKHDLDGLDNDWEVPTITMGRAKGRPEDRHNYTLLMETIRRRMDEEEARTGRHYLLTCALPPDRFIENAFEIDQLISLVDYINVMTYDMRGVHACFELHNDLSLPAGHHTNTYPSASDASGLSAQRAVEIFRAWGVPDDKIVIGSGLYANHFPNVSGGNHGLMGSASAIEDYAPNGHDRSQLIECYMNHGYVRHWDDDAKACWLYNEENHDFVSYEDEESLRWKVEYIKKEGLLGLMFCKYECDDLHTLIPAAWQAAQED